MSQILIGSLLMASIIMIACMCFYMGYRYGSNRRNIKVVLTKEQEESKRKRERLENQFDRIFSFKLSNTKEKR